MAAGKIATSRSIFLKPKRILSFLEPLDEFSFEKGMCNRGIKGKESKRSGFNKANCGRLRFS